MKEYGLFGVIAGLLLITALFIWKNSVSFIPPKPDAEIKDQVIYTNRDHTAGLVSLLKRNIGSEKLIQVCLDTWEKAFIKNKGKHPHLEQKLKQAKKVVAEEKRPVATYLRICEIMENR